MFGKRTMSVISSPSAFMLNLNAQGLFSSQTAFQRPKFNSSLKNAQQGNQRINLYHSEEKQTNRTYKPIQITLKHEDPELIFCEPVKKVKFAQSQPKLINLLKSAKKEMQQKPSKLTVEMVFETPSKATKTQPNNLFDDDAHEDSSLSFISSCSSLDNIEAIDEEVMEVHDKANVEYTLINDSQKKTTEAMIEPLVVKDSFAGQLNYLNTGNYITPNMMNYPMMIPYSQYTNTNQFMTYNDTLNKISNINQYAQSNLNNYQSIQTIMNFQQIHACDFIKDPTNFLLEEREISDHINNKFENIRAKAVDLEEDGYDSDSHATRSTGLEPNQDGKSASPQYSIGEDIPVEEKIQIISCEQIKKKKRGRKPKTSILRGDNETDGNIKAKKGRALNLDIDINPKHLKVERRLNKLQLLRYQQEASEGEFEEYMKKATDMLPISRNNSLFNETNDSQSTTTNEGKVDMIDSQITPFENTLATIPPFTLEPSRRRINLTPVWTPEDLNGEELENYLQQLGQIVEFPVTDQEKALKILKTFGMNIVVTLEAVRENKAIYSDLLKVRVKRLRRH